MCSRSDAKHFKGFVERLQESPVADRFCPLKSESDGPLYNES